jgi:glutamate synthase (NADPH/NADH) small chain
VHRQAARSVAHIDIRARPPQRRTADMPWPTYPAVLRTAPAHEEGGVRLFSVDTLEFRAGTDGGLRAVTLVEGFRDETKRFRPAGATTALPAQLALIALGFTGPEHGDLLAQRHIGLDEHGNLVRNEDFMSTEEGVFVAGDMGRGQSLIVWAIAEGRAAAAAVDGYLTSRDLLPRPIRPDHARIG